MLPDIVPGVAGDSPTVINVELAELVPQLLVAVTEMLPVADPIETVMVFVPDPEVIDAPAGTVQL